MFCIWVRSLRVALLLPFSIDFIVHFRLLLRQPYASVVRSNVEIHFLVLCGFLLLPSLLVGTTLPHHPFLRVAHSKTYDSDRLLVQAETTKLRELSAIYYCRGRNAMRSVV
ncbi:hypothetical protein D918_04177 [Trichuris suis]|nr:hypothetical protein D918_04177 [Trichuris suis]